MANKRVYYATQIVQLQPVKAETTSDSFTPDTGGYVTPQGLQSVGMTTNFNLETLFQLGQQDLYDLVEGIPEIEVTLQKTLDGSRPLYLLCMGGTTSGGSNENIGTLANNRVNFKLGVYKDTQTAAEGNSETAVLCTGMYLSSIAYNLPLDGFATEDVTLVGNHKVWSGESTSTSWTEASPKTAKHAVRRINVDISGSDAIPTTIPGGKSAHFQSISVNANLGREAINELGRMAPYARYVKFPLEVTSEFVVTATAVDKIKADDFLSNTASCQLSKNLTDEPINVRICGTGANDWMKIDLGGKNKLTSVNYTGGGTGGDNATITYSYQTYNYLKVQVNGSFANVNPT
jgi:hypothetical protein